MPKIRQNKSEEGCWEDRLLSEYERMERREKVHVSDLILCLLQTRLKDDYESAWDVTTLLRFTLGRALEKVVFKILLPFATQELEVEEEGIVGHIDFGSTPYDYECKLTSSFEPKEPEDLLDSKFWWFEQMKSYAVMRRRTEMRLVVLFLLPVPSLRCYDVIFDVEELGDAWQVMQARKEYLLELRERDELPDPTIFGWICGMCQVKYVCPKFKSKRGGEKSRGV